MRTLTMMFAVASAATTAAAQTPDPAALLRRADAALTEAGGLAFDAQVEGIGALASRTPAMTARVEIARAQERDPLGWRLRVEGAVLAAGETTPVACLAAYDGQRFRSVRYADKAVMEADQTGARDLLDDGAGWVVGWLTRWDELVREPFAGDDPPGRARDEGRATVAGVPCRVVYADYSELADPRLYGAWWFLAESDGIPRRVELHYLDDEFGDGFHRVTLSNVRAGPAAEVADATFALEVPHGFTVKAYVPPERSRGARGVQAVRPPPPTTAEVGRPAPDFSLPDPSGKVHALADYRGKVVVLDFWATWCGPCRAAMPSIQKLHEKFRDRGGRVAVFGVNCWENGNAEAYMKQNNFTYGLLLNGDDTAAVYGVKGIPTFAVIGPDGSLLMLRTGFRPGAEQEIERVIEAALEGR